MFSLPSNFVSNISTNTTGVLSALSPVAELIIGVLLGALVLGIIIRVLSGHR
jgi:F0F1-type ATP synthase assembly protein I